MAKYLLASLFAAAALASPLEERGNQCAIVSDIINIMHASAVATPFCSSLLGIPTVSKTSTVTKTPACSTVSTTVSSTATVTAYVTSTVYGTTTVYPVVAVSSTSTCALGATVIPSSSPITAESTPAPMSKRDQWGNSQPTTTAIGIPKCLTQYNNGGLTSACSCLSIPTPTSVTVTTTTLSASTITKVVASTASTTTTSTITTTSFTSTYSATQYYTSTFTILPQPTATYAPNSTDNEVYGVYSGLNFVGEDIQSFNCFPNGPPVPAPFPGCASFDDCVEECAYFNDNNLGASQNVTCGTVVYNAPPDLSSGYCYLKTGETGCGSANPNTTTGVLLPLVANDVQ